MTVENQAYYLVDNVDGYVCEWYIPGSPPLRDRYGLVLNNRMAIRIDKVVPEHVCLAISRPLFPLWSRLRFVRLSLWCSSSCGFM